MANERDLRFPGADKPDPKPDSWIRQNPSSLPPKPAHLTGNPFPSAREIGEFLAGRLLRAEEIPFSIDFIRKYEERGWVTRRKGIRKEKNRPVCERCGNRNPFFFAAYPCARCQTDCLYCRNCLMMGRISECTELFCWIGPEPMVRYADPLRWQGILSPAQKEASEAIVSCIEQGGELLIWAVCGAGKTEMLFSGIGRALELGKRVCIATPRTDVVLELEPRVRQAFPEVSVSALYGGSEERDRYSSLVVSTTHQLFRFYRAFDVMIVDEVDAFPYSVDETLKRAVTRAKKPEGSIIFLTATPEEKWQEECRRRIRPCVILPARFHRKPLPIPDFVWCGNWKKRLEKGKIPEPVARWIRQRLEVGKQAFLFFPAIGVMENALPLFQKMDPRIEAVHSEDPERKEKVMAMREGKIPILLTTTILERGVTIPNLDVAVLGAEEEVFSESALVQIAGRVGRHPRYPKGNITFFHYGKTRAMVRARNQLLRMNRDARELGMIDGE